MALTSEQQAEVELQEAIATAQSRAHTGQQKTAHKMQCLNIAYTTLIENKRSLPVEQRQVTTEEITAFANKLMEYMNT